MDQDFKNNLDEMTNAIFRDDAEGVWAAALRDPRLLLVCYDNKDDDNLYATMAIGFLPEHWQDEYAATINTARAVLVRTAEHKPIDDAVSKALAELRRRAGRNTLEAVRHV